MNFCCPKFFESVANLSWIFFQCEFSESVLNLSGMYFEHECFVNHSLGLKHILGPKKVDPTKWSKKFQSVLNLSGLVFEYESYVNHSLGIREIWFQKYLGQNFVLLKFFWMCHEYVMNLFYVNFLNLFWICQECILNMNASDS